jgi:integral membrane protein
MGTSNFKWLRIVGWLEGLSYLALLGIAVPMKHLGGDPTLVRILGLPHGILFVVFNTMAYNAMVENSWPRQIMRHAFLASILPFGTFVFDAKYLKPASTK